MLTVGPHRGSPHRDTCAGLHVCTCARAGALVRGLQMGGLCCKWACGVPATSRCAPSCVLLSDSVGAQEPEAPPARVCVPRVLRAGHAGHQGAPRAGDPGVRLGTSGWRGQGENEGRKAWEGFAGCTQAVGDEAPQPAANLLPTCCHFAPCPASGAVTLMHCPPCRLGPWGLPPSPHPFPGGRCCTWLTSTSRAPATTSPTACARWGLRLRRRGGAPGGGGGRGRGRRSARLLAEAGTVG